MPAPALLPLFAVLGPEIVGGVARIADWLMGAGGIERSDPRRKWASSLSNLSGIASFAEAFAPPSWTGEKYPWVAIPATAIGIGTSFGAKAPLQVAAQAAKAGRLTRGAASLAGHTGTSLWWRLPSAARSLMPSEATAYDTGGAEGAGVEMGGEGEGGMEAGAMVPFAGWSSPSEAALVAAAAHYPPMYRGYIDTINARTAAQMQALKSVLPQYQQAMESALQSAAAHLAASQQAEDMLRQMLLEGRQQATFLRPWEEVYKERAFID